MQLPAARRAQENLIPHANVLRTYCKEERAREPFYRPGQRAMAERNQFDAKSDFSGAFYGSNVFGQLHISSSAVKDFLRRLFSEEG
jgi:hypothetical protein